MILGSELKAEFWQHAIAVVFTAIFQLLEYVQTSVMHPMQPKLCREVSIIPADRGRVLEYKFLPTVFGLNMAGTCSIGCIEHVNDPMGETSPECLHPPVNVADNVRDSAPGDKVPRAIPLARP